MMIKIFQRYIPRSIFLLGLTELLILMISAYLGTRIHTIFDNTDPTNSSGLLLFRSALFASVMFVTIMAMGLYWQSNQNNYFDMVLRILCSFILGIGILAVFLYLFPALTPPINVINTALLSGLLGVLCIHSLYYRLSGMETLKRRVLVLGTGRAASQLTQSEWPGVNIIGYLSATNAQEKSGNQPSLLADDNLILKFAEENKINEIVVALEDRRQKMPIDSLLECKLKGFKILHVADFIEDRLRIINLDTLNPSAIIFSRGFRIPASENYKKRMFDICISLFLLVLMAPIMLLTALSILIESQFRGPVLFKQIRVGKNGKQFQMLKFRTMRVGAEKDGVPQYAEQNDPRVTMSGRLLRKLRLDELPQLINVLRGEMSFVGPRPERPEFVMKYMELIPYYRLRHETKPGITGWAQISYPYGSTDQDTIEKLQYDLYYLKHYNLALDLNILFQTVHIVLWGRGAR